MITILLKIILGLIVLALVAGIVLTIRTQTSTYQKQFLAGTLPANLPDGFYKGSADFPVFTWKGKRFDATGKTGVNVFASGASTADKYPLTLGTAEGIRDTKLGVVTLDYNRPENPFWLRPVLDEMVEIAPGTFLGKIHYRLIPFFPFSIGYFKMTK